MFSRCLDWMISQIIKIIPWIFPEKKNSEGYIILLFIVLCIVCSILIFAEILFMIAGIQVCFYSFHWCVALFSNLCWFHRCSSDFLMLCHGARVHCAVERDGTKCASLCSLWCSCVMCTHWKTLQGLNVPAQVWICGIYAEGVWGRWSPASNWVC